MEKKTQVTEQQIEVMEAIFQFSSAMSEGEVTTLDLSKVIGFSVQDGLEVLAIQCAMLHRAISMVLVERKGDVSGDIDQNTQTGD